MKSNIFLQDNEKAEKMVKISKISWSSKSIHLIIRFFSVADRAKSGKKNVKQ